MDRGKQINVISNITDIIAWRRFMWVPFLHSVWKVVVFLIFLFFCANKGILANNVDNLITHIQLLLCKDHLLVSHCWFWNWTNYYSEAKTHVNMARIPFVIIFWINKSIITNLASHKNKSNWKYALLSTCSKKIFCWNQIKLNWL